jgi:Fur family ferric uptake transcriptional regulator
MALLERLRQRGWRLTSQRRVIAEVLSGAPMHPTADEVLEQARARLPEISLATVYNTLNELVEMGELGEVDGLGRSRRYDPTTHRPHQHLVCTVCERIVDVFPPAEHLPTLPVEARSGFRDIEVDVVYRGICPECSAR